VKLKKQTSPAGETEETVTSAGETEETNNSR
jgi:hypothetical protein